MKINVNKTTGLIALGVVAAGGAIYAGYKYFFSAKKEEKTETKEEKKAS